MMTQSPSLLAAAVAAGLLFLPLGCKLDPKTPELRYEPNAKAIESNAALAASPAARASLEGALGMLYGTPAAPGYLRLAEWVDDDYEPNAGSARLDDAAYDRLEASNRAHFAQQLAAIREGRFDQVREPLYAAELWERWLELLDDRPEDPDAEYNEAGSWREEAVYLFESFYPSLRESAEMYRQQCMHCHGTAGGANGSTAPFLNPLPRDYRKGIFKFTALANKARPRPEDLFRILSEGIYTTAMPSFRRFSDAQLHGLVDYVTLLSKRGETEILLVDEYDADEGLSLETIQETYAFVDERWRDSGGDVIVYDGEVPEATPERIAHGRELFMDPKQANCVQCHGENGRGTYDNPRPASAWERNAETGELEVVKDDWGNPIEVRNLSRGVFRFGRRPIDLYRRVYAGINGTPMPAHFGMQITEPDGNQRPLGEDDIWDIVHYVRSLAAHEPHVAAATGADGGHGTGH